MALEELKDFIDAEAERHRNTKSETEKDIILKVLVDFDRTVLRHAKLRNLKPHFKIIITEMNPAFAEGYYKKAKIDKL